MKSEPGTLRAFVWLTILTAMTLFASAGAAEAQLCSNSCYISCRNADRFCQDNPNGYWSNGYAGGACADFGGTDACCKWECPNTTPTFSRCVQNPTLSGCQTGTDPLQQYCSDNYQASCTSQCNAAVAGCPYGGKCASAVISSPVGYQCSCSYTVCCYGFGTAC